MNGQKKVLKQMITTTIVLVPRIVSICIKICIHVLSLKKKAKTQRA